MPHNLAMKIRPYIDSDEPGVVDLWTAVFPRTAPHHDPVASIRKKMAVDRDLFLVATIADREIIGTAMGGYDGHRGWIYSIAVAQRHRHAGIGSALVRQVEEALIGRGCPKINLQILPSNAGVVEFYKKLGYAVEERISMGKRLP